MNKQKKYSWYVDSECHSPETFSSIEGAVNDAINTQQDKDVKILEVETLDVDDYIDGVIEAIEDSNEYFAMESGVDAEVIIDDKDEFKKSLESLIKKHCSFNPTWIASKEIGKYSTSKNEWIYKNK